MSTADRLLLLARSSNRLGSWHPALTNYAIIYNPLDRTNSHSNNANHVLSYRSDPPTNTSSIVFLVFSIALTVIEKPTSCSNSSAIFKKQDSDCWQSPYKSSIKPSSPQRMKGYSCSLLRHGMKIGGNTTACYNWSLTFMMRRKSWRKKKKKKKGLVRESES